MSFLEQDDTNTKANAAMHRSGWLRIAGSRYHSNCYACHQPITIFDSKLLKLDPDMKWSEYNGGLCCSWCSRRACRQGLGLFRSKLEHGKIDLTSKPIVHSRAQDPLSFCLGPDDSSTRKTFSRRQRQVVWEQEFGQVYNAPCRSCGIQMMVFEWHVAHKVSLAKGGTNQLTNLTATCSKCNLSMGTTSIEEFRERSGYRDHTAWSWCVLI